jgi:hypothetical protein
MDDTADLGYGPRESAAEASLDFLNQILPAGEPIFACQNQQRITL